MGDVVGWIYVAIVLVASPAAVAIASMSVLTAPVGVAVAHSLQPTLLRRVFGVYLVAIALLMMKNAMKM